MENEEGRRRHRHYSTIGMDNVFLEPPPVHTLPMNYLAHELGLDNKRRETILLDRFSTWEMVGSIKSDPEDFVVREIASLARTPLFPADKMDLVADSTTTVFGTTPDDEVTISIKSGKSIELDCQMPERIVVESKVETLPNGPPSPKARAPLAPNMPPTDVVVTILESLEKEGRLANARETFAKLQLLHDQIFQSLNESSQDHDVLRGDSYDHVLVPAVSTDCRLIRSADANKGGDRGAFHLALRSLFPLLKSDTKRNENANNSVGTQKAACAVWIRISVDDMFFGLSRHLLYPSDDLIALYRFRNAGCVPSLDSPIENQSRRGKKRGRDVGTAACKDSESDCHRVLLRLRPNISRDDRRPIHHMITRQGRQFATSTVNICTDLKEGFARTKTTLSSESTTGIAVQWSAHAQKKMLHKSKLRLSGRTDSGNINTLCVLKKTRKEHLNALQLLSATLRCRLSDIGVAGIKDMHAVTYQFCTIRNMTPQRTAAKAQAHLGRRGVELGSFCPVDWTLSLGHLEGNRFELTVRDLGRIQVHRTSEGWSESRIPCDACHINLMVKRLRDSGFINFYGEQRLGDPGTPDEVGVRPFDIGRALLQEDFSSAVDLLMRGRRGAATEGPDMRRARKVWIDTRGDVAETLKALPKGGVMPRERAVLQGLKRYGSSEWLAALRCLPFAVRTLWINAYQSLVWNTMASERMRRFGTTIVEGDLFLKQDDKDTIGIVDVDNIHSVDICEVVLPLPGFNVLYPTNEIGDKYRAFLAKDKVRFRRNVPSECTARGSYRKLISFPKNLHVTMNNAAENPNKPVSSITLKFDLSSGCYATVMLRELMVTTVIRDTFEGDTRRCIDEDHPELSTT